MFIQTPSCPLIHYRNVFGYLSGSLAADPHFPAYLRIGQTLRLQLESPFPAILGAFEELPVFAVHAEIGTEKVTHVNPLTKDLTTPFQ